MLKEEWKVYKSQLKEAITDLKTKGRRKQQIPNVITSFRLLAPFVILPFSVTGNIPGVLISVAAFSITDAMDGLIARKFHLTSDLGRDLDALCDKLFSGTLLVAASLTNPIMSISLLLEGLIGGINTRAKLKGYSPKSLYIGKLKTVFLFPLLGLSLVTHNLVFKLVFSATTSLQILTISAYLRKYKKIEQETFEEIPLNPSDGLLLENNESDEQTHEKVLEKVDRVIPVEKECTNRRQKIQTLKDMRNILLKEIGMSEEDTLEKGTKSYFIDK